MEWLNTYRLLLPIARLVKLTKHPPHTAVGTEAHEQDFAVESHELLEGDQG